MVRHIVMWKLKDEAAGATKAQNARKLKTKLESLQQTIPQLKFAEVGINFNISQAAYDVVLYSEFENKEALQAYQMHPEHKKLITDFLDKVRTDKKVVDYEV
ncbi:Dabb family protein [candidate division KSB1 bacterium]|nr:Dabb family protein [candidate division KSB1 bacterium]NIR71226.1 Dabb family protein [candidate division KSB1 bacterium]NIS27600.1 Dabb family protein [candidate division KSB1 bacterium]NIT72951.1 Dabb family protein [candidate division KSB1 bacterium]NIU28316.1 Dabb family protein [candidate division KSB1 bacterium]